MSTGWNERVVTALESIAASLEAMQAAISSDGLRVRTLSPAEAATTTTTSTTTTSTSTTTPEATTTTTPEE